MEFVPFVILAVMVKKLIDWIKELIPDRFEPKVLLPFSWLVGVLVVALFSTSPELAGEIQIWSDHTLADASFGLVVVYGFAVGTGANVAHDATRRIGDADVKVVEGPMPPRE